MDAQSHPGTYVDSDHRSILVPIKIPNVSKILHMVYSRSTGAEMTSLFSTTLTYATFSKITLVSAFQQYPIPTTSNGPPYLTGSPQRQTKSLGLNHKRLGNPYMMWT
uniref:AlNc14C145G7352 protein n=1 Tax=Albugo laibachii Nc14 TaxID=890382 RepID=F0WLG5_9STRA|nr:AlNc14C145G7352 [Albugo laibachii Nc14]|eukprot:CCA22128.1 AlNc14C145G7352 [Albugo laibachii Nc14]